MVYFGAPAIAGFYRIPEVEPVLRAGGLPVPARRPQHRGKSLLTRELRFRLYVALDVGSYLVGYACVGVVLAWLGSGVWALVIANLSRSGCGRSRCISPPGTRSGPASTSRASQ